MKKRQQWIGWGVIASLLTGCRWSVDKSVSAEERTQSTFNRPTDSHRATAEIVDEGDPKQSKGQGPAAKVTCRILHGYKGGDTIEAIAEGDGVVFRIGRLSGISTAEVVLIEGAWPRTMRLEFVDWGNLESLAITYEYLSLNTSLAASPRVAVNVRGENGGFNYDPSRDTEFRMPMKKEGGNLIVELPVNLFSSQTKSFALSWVDAFR